MELNLEIYAPNTKLIDFKSITGIFELTNALTKITIKANYEVARWLKSIYGGILTQILTQIPGRFVDTNV